MNAPKLGATSPATSLTENDGFPAENTAGLGIVKSFAAICWRSITDNSSSKNELTSQISQMVSIWHLDNINHGVLPWISIKALFLTHNIIQKVHIPVPVPVVRTKLGAKVLCMN